MPIIITDGMIFYAYFSIAVVMEAICSSETNAQLKTMLKMFLSVLSFLWMQQKQLEHHIIAKKFTVPRTTGEK